MSVFELFADEHDGDEQTLVDALMATCRQVSASGNYVASLMTGAALPELRKGDPNQAIVYLIAAIAATQMTESERERLLDASCAASKRAYRVYLARQEAA